MKKTPGRKRTAKRNMGGSLLSLFLSLQRTNQSPSLSLSTLYYYCCCYRISGISKYSA